jgi:hypothetical protein
LILGFLSPYFPKKKIYMLAPEKKGLAPKLFLVLATPDYKHLENKSTVTDFEGKE